MVASCWSMMATKLASKLTSKLASRLAIDTLTHEFTIRTAMINH